MYNLYDRVEALLEHGWSRGNVSEVLGDGRYRVYVKHLKKEVLLNVSALRPPTAQPGVPVESSKADKRMDGAKENYAQLDQLATSVAPTFDLNEVAVGEQPEIRDVAADTSASPERNLENSQDIIKPPAKKKATYRRKGKRQASIGATRPKSQRQKHAKFDSGENFSRVSDDETSLSARIPEAGITDDTARNGDTPAPFAKTSPLWEAVDSLEIFRKMPQCPHFRPLSSRNEIIREGLAIAAMANFSAVVRKISNFNLDEPASLLEDCLETLSELETHGFVVEPIRKRVDRLLSIKTRYDEAQGLSRELINEKGAMSELDERFDEEIEDINEQIQRLEDQRSAAEAERAAKDDDIRALQAQFDEVRGVVEGARDEFERVANAPW